MSLTKIIIHWTAGQYQPNAVDRIYYHRLVALDDVNEKPNIINGKFKPEDNLSCLNGRYAAHTGGGNTGSVGWAFCGMLGFRDKNNVGNYPLTKAQCEAGFAGIARDCKKYGIPVTPQTVMTHRTFGLAHPKTSSAGKIDICYLPPYPQYHPDDIDDFIRGKIKWYLSNLKGG